MKYESLLGMSTAEGDERIRRLIEDVYNMDDEAAIKHMRSELTIISIDHPEVCEPSVREMILLLTGEEFSEVLL